MPRRDEIVSLLEEVPSLPAGSLRVIALLQDPQVEFAAIAKAVESDPGLTTNLLRWANSAYFGGRHKIVSVRDAGPRLGIKRMHQVVMMSIAAPLVGAAAKGYELDTGALLDHSIAVALATGIVGEAAGHTLPDHAFTAGLLHDTGKLALARFVGPDSAALRRLVTLEGVRLDEAERAVLGIDHAEAGALLLGAWGIPSEIVEVVRWHHGPAGFEGDRAVVDAVHMADLVARGCGLGAGIGGARNEAEQSLLLTAAAGFGLGVEEMEAISARIISDVAGTNEAIGA